MTTPPSAQAPKPNRPPAVSVPSGLTRSGVYVVVLAGSLVGLLVDVFTGGGVGWIYGVAFCASSAYAALEVRASDRLAAVIAPPLVFAFLMLVDSLARGSGDWASRLINTANDLLRYGPMLWAGTTLAILVVGGRTWLGRRTSSIQR